MTDKERLEEIKNIHEKFLDLDKKERYQEADDVLLYLREKHMNWLIQQAERVQELKIKNKRYQEVIEDIKNVWKVTDTHQEYMDTVHDIIKDLEGEE